MKRLLLLTLLFSLLPAAAAAQGVAACDDPKVIDLTLRIARDMITQRQGQEVGSEVGLALSDIQSLGQTPDNLGRSCRGVLAVQRRAGSQAATQFLNYTIQTQIGGRTYIRFADNIFVPPQ
ncbi:hypothetical protein [Megalodesulfovibrio paquesii]